MKKCLIFLTLTGMFFPSIGQRKYANSSVLSAGEWLKISVESSGIYKIAASDLKQAGFSGAISSAQIRLFGNGGRVLPESNADPVTDDLQENAIEIYDGGMVILMEPTICFFMLPVLITGSAIPLKWGFNSKKPLQ